ncbi:hypothetical protein LCGC14_1273710 [marine sediment metagenome]|uniref:Uncharacterized protein n=1 Tax=marine sediment metagenome TaxID=412755 RepID=A0A0F9P0D9_9ZZZZ
MPRWIALATERLTVDATSGGVGFAEDIAATPGIERAVCKVETAQVRVQTEPDTTLTQGGAEGSSLWNVGDSFNVTGQEDMKNFKAIRTGGSSGALSVTFEGTRV